jgi:hypothetical protein
MSWGSALGEIRTDTVLRINERGEWTEPGGNINRYATAKEFWELIVKPRFELPTSCSGGKSRNAR